MCVQMGLLNNWNYIFTEVLHASQQLVSCISSKTNVAMFTNTRT